MSNLIDRKEHGQMTMLQQAKGEVSEEENKGSNTKNLILGKAKKRDKSNIPTPTPTEKVPNKTEENSDVNSDAPRTYKEMLKRFLKEKIAGKGLTPEQREKRDMRLAKISDGISAIANLVATTQGARNSFTGENTRTENTRKRWEEFYNKRKEEQRQIYEDQMRALKLEEAIRDRNNEEAKSTRSPIQRESEAIKQEQQTSNSPIQRESSSSKTDNVTKTVSANTQKTVANNLLQKSSKPAKEDVENKYRIVFDDGTGNSIAIHKDVWKGSMQQVFNTLIDEGIGRSEHTTPERYKKRMSEMSNSQKEDFVKMNWNKSKKAKDLMFSYSKKNPPTITSKISDEDVIDYVPGKK